MTLTKALLEQWFEQFNRLYFAGELPLPRLALSKARTRLGTMSCRRERSFLKTVLKDFTIRVSTYYEQDQRGYQTVLLHEMIHYYIAFKGLRDDAPHGRIFRRMMTELNTRHGWNISVSTSMRGAATTVKKPQQQRLVLTIKMKNGERWVSVVNPRYAKSIAARLRRLPQVASFGWYASSDSFFANFPQARSLRGRKVSEDFFEQLKVNRMEI